MTPPRLPSLQGYPEPGWRNDEMLCWCYSSRTSTSVLNLSQHNEVSDRLNNQPHTHTHIDTHRHTDLTVVLLLVSLCMWTVSLFLCFKFSDWSHLFGLLFCFSARITNDGWGACFSALKIQIFLAWVLFWYLDLDILMLWLKHSLIFKLNVTKSYTVWMIYDQSLCLNQMHGSVFVSSAPNILKHCGLIS